MTSLKPGARSMVWNHRTAADRVVDCARMLRVHGFLSDAEVDRVLRRVR